MPSDLRRVELSLRKALEVRKENNLKTIRELQEFLDSPEQLADIEATKRSKGEAEARYSAFNIALFELEEAISDLQTGEKYRRRAILEKLSLLTDFSLYSDEKARSVTKQIFTFILEEML